MSRVLVKDSDNPPADRLPELKISAHPNLVTTQGLAEIEATIERLSHALAATPRAAEGDRIQRDLRYWIQRRSSARVVEPPHGSREVTFGSRITVRRDGRPPEILRIVGEDEADPFEGLLSWTSPMARALIGATPGVEVVLDGREPPIVVEVFAVDNG
jgi:transcription elongation GreA/GreB family factor